MASTMPLPTLTVRVLVSLTCLAVLASNGRAQPTGARLDLRYSYTANHHLAAGTVPAGEVAVDAALLTWRDGFALSDTSRMLYGASWATYSFQRSGAAVPGQLHEVAFEIGLMRVVDRQWRLMASATPGLYGDFKGDAGAALNVPVLLLASYARSRDLTWSFGLRGDRFSDNPVLPLAGVDWQFAPDWRFVIGYPRAGLDWKVSPAWRLGLGVTAQGGSFHVSADPRGPGATPGLQLGDTRLTYREIRLGLGVEYQLGQSLVLKADAGVVADQKFDYHERDTMFDGGSAAFLAFGLGSRW